MSSSCICCRHIALNRPFEHRSWFNTMVRVVLLLVALSLASCTPGEAREESSRDMPPLEEVVSPTGGWDPWHGRYSLDGKQVAFYGWDPSFRPRVGVPSRFTAPHLVRCDSRTKVARYARGGDWDQERAGGRRPSLRLQGTEQVALVSHQSRRKN